MLEPCSNCWENQNKHRSGPCNDNERSSEGPQLVLCDIWTAQISSLIQEISTKHKVRAALWRLYMKREKRKWIHMQKRDPVIVILSVSHISRHNGEFEVLNWICFLILWGRTFFFFWDMLSIIQFRFCSGSKMAASRPKDLLYPVLAHFCSM